ncbi:hypothetical protein ACFQ3H_12685, partial [Paralysiella testudinis]|uniref:hypothetical protein n=1 Tax=Paralysiella testudinis TaxID=2809020 RepID=UPI00362D3D88
LPQYGFIGVHCDVVTFMTSNCEQTLVQKRVQARQKAQPKPALARIFNAACACLCTESSTIKDCEQALRLPEALFFHRKPAYTGMACLIDHLPAPQSL